MNRELISLHARELGCTYDIHAVDETTSTNDDLKRLGAEGAPNGYALVAERQTAGRGMHGRGFFSPESGVYLSVLLRPDTLPEEMLHFTAAAGVAVCHAIERLTPHKAQIKWVNDIYIGGKKVCGILTESVIENALVGRAVIGIGINITEPTGGFPAEIADRACALFTGGKKAPQGFAELLAAEVLAALEHQLSLEWSETLAEYRRRSCLTGREVRLADGGKALVTGITEEGSLSVLREDGTQEIVTSGYSVTVL